MKPLNRSKGITATLGVAALCGLAACGDGGDATDEGLQTVTLRLDFTPSGHQAPFFYGVSEGIYEEHGLDVQVEHGRGSAVTAQSVGSGEDEFGHANIGPTMNAIDSGYETKILATLTNRNSWVVYSDEQDPIESLEAFAGKEVILSGGTPDQYLTEAVFADNDIDISEVEIQQVDLSAKVSLYTQGEGDGLVTSIPYGDPMVQDGRPSHSLAYADAGQDLVDYGLLANQGVIDSDPDMVERFVQATVEAYEAAQESPEDAAAAVAAEWDDLTPEQIQTQWELQMEHIDVEQTEGLPMGCSTPDLWEDSVQLLQEHAGLDADSTVDDFYSEEYLDCGDE